MNRVLLLSAATAWLLAACGDEPTRRRWEYMPDMVDSVAYDAFDENPVTADGKTLMAPAPGAIPRERLPLHYGPGPEEAARAGRELVNPLSADKAALAAGERSFQIFCLPCHGKKGQGDGPVIPRFPVPPSLTAPHARTLPDGQLFHIVSRGQGLMPSYAVQVPPDDRWQIVLFIRAMQAEAKP